MITPVHKEQGKSRHPDWGTIYSKVPYQDLPWFLDGLDQDIEVAINLAVDNKNDIIQPFSHKDLHLLDMGCGDGSQAAALAKQGFSVTGWDISGDAVTIAQNRFPGHNPTFLAKDCVNCPVNETFDVIIDRGLLHVLSTDDATRYMENIFNRLNINGVVIIKGFAANPTLPQGFGPRGIELTELESYAHPSFKLERCIKGEFQGPRKTAPTAWVATYRRTL